MNRINLTLLLLLLSVVVFGKEKWKSYRISADESSPENDIYSICFDQSGNLWAGTNNGVYFQDKNGKWSLTGLKNCYVQCLYIDRDNTMWAGLWGEGVYQSTNGSDWKNIKKASPTGSVNTITSDIAGNIWIGDWAGGAVVLSEKNKHILTFYNDSTAGLGDNSITSIVCDDKNNLWIGTYHGVSVFNNGTWKKYDTGNSQLPDNDVYALTTGKDGTIWIGTAHGLARISRAGWTVYTRENSKLSCDLILSIATDDRGKVWVGTNKGIFSFDGKKWTDHSVRNSNIAGNRIQTITVRGRKVFLGTDKGISVFSSK